MAVYRKSGNSAKPLNWSHCHNILPWQFHQNDHFTNGTLIDDANVSWPAARIWGKRPLLNIHGKGSERRLRIRRNRRWVSETLENATINYFRSCTYQLCSLIKNEPPLQILSHLAESFLWMCRRGLLPQIWVQKFLGSWFLFFFQSSTV